MAKLSLLHPQYFYLTLASTGRFAWPTIPVGTSLSLISLLGLA
jgi:hypothetical protein